LLAKWLLLWSKNHEKAAFKRSLPMRQLTPEELRKLRELLPKVFVRSTLDMLLQDRLGTTLDLQSSVTNFAQQVRELLNNANMEGWIYNLVLSAAYERPHAPDLLDFARGLGLTEKVERTLEAFLTTTAPQDLPRVRQRLFELEQQVCRVTFPIGANLVAGTGFLVGPDLIMTNYHVVEKIIEGVAAPKSVRALFDYKTSQDGSTVYAGVEHALAENNPIEVYSAYHPNDLQERPVDDSWPSDKLDFAILRLGKNIGEKPAGPMVTDAGTVERPPRGWIRFPTNPLPFSDDRRITIIQHPMGEPIKIASDEATSWNSTMTRVRYRTNTLHGSSGSPCLNSKWEWVALHHCGDPAWKPRYNQGIPVSTIVAHLRATGRLALLQN
jgi:V8-like Glu-specific endopeptidase